ncbi:MAG: VWA domain-containing protein, partial [Polyangiales bacterium]
DHLSLVDRRTTVVVIGDGRNNYQADEAWVLADLKRRARALLWINPERRGSWSIGDSAMHRYAPSCTRVLEVACAAELEEAARALITL